MRFEMELSERGRERERGGIGRKDMEELSHRKTGRGVY